MVLRSKPLVVIAASCFVLFQGDFTQAQNKSRAGGRTKARSAEKAASSKPGPSGPAKPAAPTVKIVPVCVRPDGVDKKVEKWTYSETNKLVVADVESTARRLGNWVYQFDKKAGFDTPAFLPAPHNRLKCPDDKRRPAAPKPAGFLPSAGPMFTSPNPLGSSPGFLSPSSLGSSATGKSPSILVNQFVEAAAQFHMTGNPDANQATQMAHKLRNSITTKKPMAEIAVGDLSPNAATLLANAFGESLAAAMAQQPVIGPLNVMQKISPTGKKPKWTVFALVNGESMADREIIAPDEVPGVMLSTADYQHRKNVVASLVRGALPVVMLRLAYEQAYADKPEWFTSIASYF